MLSPLRYPGGKSKLFDFISEVINHNRLYSKIYCEPYAGGAGLALKLLAYGFTSKIEINDLDPAIYAFWSSILESTDDFCRLIHDTPLTMTEWTRQREIYNEGNSNDQLTLGFSAYFLNRTNRSGIISGSGPIGGKNQSGEWKLDARFNKKNQINNIYNIGRLKSSIRVFNQDAIEFCESRLKSEDFFLYLDPPYYVKGNRLYRNSYVHQDHVNIKNLLIDHTSSNWMLSYDLTPEILEIYHAFPRFIYTLNYSAGSVGRGKEVIYSSDAVQLPKSALDFLAA